jgi:hypothetical protein
MIENTMCPFLVSTQNAPIMHVLFVRAKTQKERKKKRQKCTTILPSTCFPLPL